MTTRIYTFLLLCTTILFISSCRKKNQCSQPAVTTANIQGSWKHSYPTNLEPSFVQPDYYNQLRFTADSFYLERTYNTDIMVPNCGHTEYMKGVYALKNDQVQLTGAYTNADYSVKTTIDCNHTGNFNTTYDIGFCNENLILSLPNSTAAEQWRIIKLIK